MATSDTVRIHRTARRVRVLGPGVRYVLWVQGCPRGCPGCISPEAQDPAGGEIRSVAALAEAILAVPDIEGVTISGGEPFLQAEALCSLIARIRARRDLGVIIYTGYVLEELQSGAVPHAEALLARTDLLVDGPYVDALNDDGALRGSSNQRAIPLTGRYARDAASYGAPGERKVELGVSDDGVFLSGVPSRATVTLMTMGNPGEEQA